jgi:ectoine hydroxylase-related dioxygenase (phytanoyl-CoA dioxygenase family)
VTRLVGRSKTVREDFFSDPLYQELCEHFLAIETTAWYGDEGRTNTSHPLLSISIAFDIPPGTSAQGLHRDDKNHHARHSAVQSYHKNRDMLFGLFVPGCDTTKENGATRVVVGSHLWGDDKPDFPEATDATMKVGEALIMLGSLYHGGGNYPKPLKDSGKESRTVYAMFCCSGVHRQEEISYLSYPVEEVRTYSKLMQDRLGWKQSEPNLGWVDLRSPEFMLQ